MDTLSPIRHTRRPSGAQDTPSNAERTPGMPPAPSETNRGKEADDACLVTIENIVEPAGRDHQSTSPG
ncbi:MAG: hypothetical protein JRJ84_04375 [Deltaproteobacteria bacterium]|nr:hypothetical protein [Deltaproteobacteria bacterium]